MSYMRVIPRDLFNESKLLKCLGQLSLILHDYPGRTPLALSHSDGEFSGFYIEQDPNDGALYCSNIELTCRGRLIGLRSPYNSKDPYPLRFALDDEEGRVFDENGNLSEELKVFVESLT